MTEKRVMEYLSGYTNMRELSLRAAPPDWKYQLSLRLENKIGGERQVDFMDVSGVSLKEIGGGMTQFMLLKIEDVSKYQLDRIQYKISEIEHGRISFSCQAFKIAN
jgi:hypothetical protein